MTLRFSLYRAPAATTPTTTLLAATSHYTTFAVNPETAQPTTGRPRGLVNKMASLGLPPWAAWTRKLDRFAMYRMSAASNTDFLPKHPHDIDGIWLNEKVRERVRSTRDKQYCMKQLKYPYMRTGVWFSDALDHWVQVPHVKGAAYHMEREGGFDNFILKRSGSELHSKYGERVRRHILGRQREIEKNFLLQKNAEKLADHVLAEAGEGGLEDVLSKYGMDKAQILQHAESLRAQ